jgi:hypothetical protein
MKEKPTTDFTDYTDEIETQRDRGAEMQRRKTN